MYPSVQVALLFCLAYGNAVNGEQDPSDSSLLIKNEHTRVLIPCRKDDMEGMQKSMYLFMEKTCGGVPEYNITATDPFIIPAIDIPGEECASFHFTDIHVGLTFWQYIKFNVGNNLYEEVIRMYPDIHAGLQITLNSGKVFTGTLRASSNSTISVHFKYTIKKECRGKRHLNMEQECIDVKTESTPQVILDPEFKKELFKDPDARRYYTQHPLEPVVKEMINQALKELAHTMIENFRIVFDVLPVTGFFLDL